MLRKVGIALLGTLAIASCESQNHGAATPVPIVNKAAFAYDSNSTGTCDTENHSFSTIAEFCTGLQNDALNNNCDLVGREKLFQENCTGTFTEVTQ